MAECGDAILVSGWIALETTALAAAQKKEKLQQRLPMRLIRTAESFTDETFLQELSPNRVKEALKQDVQNKEKAEKEQTEVREVLEKGIFHALWDLAEETGKGLDVELKKIPIRQETVEVGEVFDLNPYQARSGGCCIIVTSDGISTLDKLGKAGIPAVCIGLVTKGPAKILRSGEDIRYLDKPRYQDEIMKINQPK